MSGVYYEDICKMYCFKMPFLSQTHIPLIS